MTTATVVHPAHATAAALRAALPPHLASPTVAIICGSGLSILARNLVSPHTIPYATLPGFVSSTVPGHAGELAFGILGGKPVVLMLGRFHLYEGHTPEETAFPVRVFHALGVRRLIVTNAAGSLNADMAPGDFGLLRDHISLLNLSGHSPLQGPNVDEFGPRFPALANAYSHALRTLAYRAYIDLKIDGSSAAHAGRLHEAVYVNVAGPGFETPAEARFLRLIGADVVGMSTAGEVTVARHCGMEVLGVSLVTNRVGLGLGPSVIPRAGEALVQGDAEVEANHDEVLAMARERAEVFSQWIEEVVARM